MANYSLSFNITGLEHKKTENQLILVFLCGRWGTIEHLITMLMFLDALSTLYERKIIESKAKKSNLTISEYLREIGLTAKIDYRNKALPKEILSFTEVLNHMAANLNQIAKKRNSNDELSPLERAALKVQSGHVKDLAVQIKNFMS